MEQKDELIRIEGDPASGQGTGSGQETGRSPGPGGDSKRSELLAAFDVHRDFCRIFQDAYVLVDAGSGRIIKYNQMFCQMVSCKAFDLRKEPRITELLDSPEGSTDFARLLGSQQPLRVDELQLVRMRSGDELQVIASSYPFVSGDGALLGCCVLLRDVTAEASLQGKYTERTMESLTDPLTGLLSRRFLERVANGEHVDLAIAGNGTALMSILMCDIDHFKRMNDSHGHLGGDAVLRAVAQELRKACRSSDRVIRYGGEEFAILLPDTGHEGMCIVAEKIRRAVAALQIQIEGASVGVTISIGGAERTKRSESIKSIVALADECLYKAKAAGRNRCIVVVEGQYIEASADAEWHPFTELQAS